MLIIKGKLFDCTLLHGQADWNEPNASHQQTFQPTISFVLFRMKRQANTYVS